jgi:hypothetical protein
MDVSELHQSIRHLVMPANMARLPLTEKGYPTLFFAAMIDGKADLRVMDGAKWTACVKRKLCWLCGKPLWPKRQTFVLGPMCTVTRTSSEPPSHYECAVYAVQACPFLTRPHMKRNEAGLPDDRIVNGFGIMRNPGVSAVWVTDSYKLFSDQRGGLLVRVGRPKKVEYWCEARPATGAEVIESFQSGLPTLYAQCFKDDDPADSRKELDKMLAIAMQWLPDRPRRMDGNAHAALMADLKANV